jgi:cell division protein FtsL
MDRLETKKIRFRPSLLIVLGIVLVVTMISQLAFLSVFGTKGKEIANIRTQQKELILENELLEAEISKRQSLVRIKEIATEELGLVNVGDVEYIAPNHTVSENNN